MTLKRWSWRSMNYIWFLDPISDLVLFFRATLKCWAKASCRSSRWSWRPSSSAGGPRRRSRVLEERVCWLHKHLLINKTDEKLTLLPLTFCTWSHWCKPALCVLQTSSEGVECWFSSVVFSWSLVFPVGIYWPNTFDLSECP